MMLSNGKVAPMDKLTDSDIGKALECCIDGDCCKENCPIFDERDSLSKCTSKLSGLTLDLINRLQAENEVYETCNARKDEAIKSLESRLKKLQMQFDDISKLYSEIKAQAYKEFADRLKEKKARYNADNFFVIDYIPFKEIDNTLKELVGDK